MPSMITNVKTPAAIGFPVRRVALDAPWEWLARGWRDFCALPALSLAYGAFFTLIAWGMSFGLAGLEAEALIPVLASGFVLLGPLAAAGLYEIARCRETGDAVTLQRLFYLDPSAASRLAQFGVVLFCAFFIWVLLAFVLLTLFLNTAAVPPASDLLHTLLFTEAGLGLLISGTLVGAVIATTVFCVSTVAGPLLLVADIDVVSAIITSLRAARLNALPMMLWAGLIAGFMILGLITMFAGLVVVLPLLGFATWHAFRDLVPDAHQSGQ
jgi:uncharacterized membrane protein